MQTYSAPTDDERTWGMYAHLSGLLAFTGVPFGGTIGPLIMYLQNKPIRPFAMQQAREALNFHITYGIVQFVALIVAVSAWLSMALSVATGPKNADFPLAGFSIVGVSFAAFLAVYLWTFVFTMIATIRASGGMLYRYPLTLRFWR